MAKLNENPCSVCKAKDCWGCALNHIISGGKDCSNYDCFLNRDFGCILSIDRTCKASTCYEKDELESEE